MKSKYVIHKLGDYIKQVLRKNKDDSNFTVFSVTNTSGFIKSDEYFSKEVFSKKLTNYNIVNPGEFAYNPSRINVGSIDFLNNDEPVLVSPLYNVFQTDENVDNNYLKHFIKSNYGLSQIDNLTTGSVRDSLKYSALERMKVPVPPLADQVRITALLLRIEGLIARRKESIALLDEYVKSVFLEMFGVPSNNHRKFDVGTIADLVNEVKYGTSSPAEEDGIYKYLRMNNITINGYWDLSDLKYINVSDNDKEKYLIRRGDIVFNRTNSKELVGKTAVYNSDEEMIIAGYLIRLRVNEKANPWFIWGHLNSFYGKKYLFNLCRNIVGMANINAKELQNIKILMPPVELQNKFERVVEKVEAMKVAYQESLSELEKLYGSVSQRAFRGEI